MGTSTALSLLQSEFKIPVFLRGVHGRPEGWEESSALGGTEHWQVLKCSLMSPPPVPGGDTQVGS